MNKRRETKNVHPTNWDMIERMNDDEKQEWELRSFDVHIEIDVFRASLTIRDEWSWISVSLEIWLI